MSRLGIGLGIDTVLSKSGVTQSPFTNIQVFRNDGNDLVQRITPPSFLGTSFRFGIDDYTFEQIFKITSNTGANQVLSLWGRLSSRQLGFGIDLTGGGGAHLVRSYLGGINAIGSSTETITLNKWYRVKVSCKAVAPIDPQKSLAQLYLDDGNGYQLIASFEFTPTTIVTTERFQLFASNLATSENPQALFSWTSFYNAYYADGVVNQANLVDRWKPENYNGGSSFVSENGNSMTVTDNSPTGTIVNDDVPTSFFS